MYNYINIKEKKNKTQFPNQKKNKNVDYIFFLISFWLLFFKEKKAKKRRKHKAKYRNFNFLIIFGEASGKL